MNFLLKQNWWKYVGVILVASTIVVGLLMPVPRKDILNETIRNTFFHVPMWFSMLLVLVLSLVYSVKYLRTFNPVYDTIAATSANVGLWLGCFGLGTGMLWAQYTWGAFWNNDPRQTTAAVFMLIYLAYFVLRGSMDDRDKRAKVAGVYNIFAFFAYIPLMFIVPRLMGGLHPGGQGNPVISKGDMDVNMKQLFYVGVIGWTLMGFWMVSLKVRLELVKEKILSQQMN